jgi:hypothetical protein
VSLAGPLQIAVRVGEAFDKLGVRWVVVGALAASLYGIPRATHDVDLYAELALEQVDALLADLSAGFFADKKQVVSGIQNRSWFSVVHIATMTKVDVFLSRDESLAKAQLDRRVNFRVYRSEAILPLLSAEDTVLQALAWYRRSERKAVQQRQDAVGVLRVCGATLDRQYLKKVAKQEKLTGLLESAERDAQGSGHGPTTG